MDTAGLNAVRSRIANAAVAAGRRSDEIDLIVVSKMRSDAEVLTVYEAGERKFGENRQQGLKARVDATLPGDIEWHFIGPYLARL